MSTLEERINAVREILDAQEGRVRVGKPTITVVRNMVNMLERTLNAHPVLVGHGNPWCRRCLLDWPCAEVTEAENLLRSVETLEADSAGQAGGEARA